MSRKQYSVVMEYSVLVTSDELEADEEELTPELAEQIALGWLNEEPANCNPIIVVRDTGPGLEPFGAYQGAVVRKTIDGQEVAL
jgi:hypothetical protein